MIRMLLFLMLSFHVQSAEVTDHTSRLLNKAITESNNGKHSEAISQLERTTITRKVDRAMVNRVLGLLYWKTEQTEQAIHALSKAVADDVLDEQRYGTRKLLADLLYFNGDYPQAIKEYDTLLQSKRALQESDRTFILQIARSWYQLENWSKASQALAIYPKEDNEADIPMLSLLLNAQINQQQWTSATTTMLAMLEYQPENMDGWRQLTHLYIKDKQYNKALSSLALAVNHGLDFTEQDLSLLKQLYLNQNLPFSAAILGDNNKTKDIQELRLQAYYWQAAREWNKAAQTLSLLSEQDKRYFWELALVYNRMGHYQQALDALDAVVDVDQKKVDDLKLSLTERIAQQG